MPARPLVRPIAWIDPEALFLAGPAIEAHAFWLDGGPHAESGWSWLGTGEPAPGLPDDVPLAVSHGASPPEGDIEVPGGFAGGWVGWSGYDAGARRAGAPARRDTDAPEDAAIRVTHLVAFDHAARRAWILAPDGDERVVAEVEAWCRRARENAPPSGERLPEPTPSRTAKARHTPEDYGVLISRCRDAIRAGDAYQLCLTTRFEVDAADGPIDAVATYLRLRRAQPAHHGGMLRCGPSALLSASPEQFLHVRDGIVRTRPIKGTRPRGADPDSDAEHAADLLASPKERAENVMIVDLMRNDLHRVCVPGTVAAERLLEVESYPAVHQLVSTVAGRLLPGTTTGDLMAAAFPAGSMTGAPKLSAMTVLHTLEAAPRGVYAGCFGWVGTDGAADLAMTIRSVVVHSGGAYVGAGGGITWLSETDAELAEVAVKARGPLAALGAELPPAWAALDGPDGPAEAGRAVPPVR
ncbi:anthranilate synthase component I family protein [Microbacterium sp. MMO-56]|uniref:anthranilate synthase component I family protein n=1 Tax=unclassified Microbacterium TaxID=2609290 RepID=UPI003FA57F5F